MKRALSLAAAACLLSAPAFAAHAPLTFGIPLSGTGPTVAFATLGWQQTAGGSGDDWTFTLDAMDFNGVFGSPNAFIGSIAFEVPGDSPNYASGLDLTNVSGGVSTATVVNGAGPAGIYDFRINLGQGANDRLTAGESVSFTWADSGYTSFTNVALHVQGLEDNTAGNSTSIWYGPGDGPLPAIPEPGTYALMLAGLAAMGFVARRRRQA